jgi:hypothetical protein
MNKKESGILSPPSIPPAWGGEIKLLPLDGGSPGGGEKNGETSALLFRL